MKKSMKMLAWMLCFIMVLGMFPMVQAEEAPVYANEDDIVVYYTNDVHTYIDGALSYDNLADLKAKTAEQAAGVLLVDAGDAVQGTAYGSMDKGETIVKLMEATGYDLATLGNHEFDYGMERALEIAQDGKIPYVSCNFYHELDGEIGDKVLDAYKIFEIAGKKIAFIGITTPESFTKSTPAYFQDENGNYIYGIGGGETGWWLYAYVQDAIYAAEKAGADYIIALGHLGDDPASQPWTSEEVIANVKGLDAFIDGHSHSTVAGKLVKDEDGNDVLLTQTGEYFGAIGKMVIAADGTITTSLITEHAGSDADVKAIKDAWMTEIDTKLGEVIGYTDVVFDNYDATGRLVRKVSTNTGNLAADALYYLFDNMGLDVDVAIMNGGGVRNKTVTGEISYKTAKEIHTFGNVACLQTITGQQLLDALEWGAKATNTAENGGFLHVSGITYEIDNTIESTVQMDEKGVWAGGPTGEYRVRNVKIWQDGAYVDLDLNAQYNLAGYNYTLRDLGDGFAMFDGAVNVLDYVMEDYMVLANYVKSFPVNENGLPEIPADDPRYASVYGDGRIKLVNPFFDVPAGQWYTDAVLWAVDEEITTGATPVTFNPNGDLLRAQVVTMLWRAAGAPVVEAENPFTDVKESDFFYNAVLWAVDEGITTGTSETEFSPFGITNRAQAVTFLYRFMGEPELGFGGGDLPFSDMVEGAFYVVPVLWANEYGITNGLGDGTFGINENCNRAHMVTFLYRASLIEVPEEPAKPTYQVFFKDDGNGTVTCDVSSATPGDEIHFFAVPNEGYYFSEFVLFDPNMTFDVSTIELYEGEQENEYVVTMIDYPLLVTCKFAPVP
ncbi:MAG: 5'-nucleotidase C-terminal domain-containing protein [Oscillospiraceae bacterium]|nr:5'-nucleotidase C-terminal domain-containing protein [Oscillospiraceae bacterium]